MGFGLGFGCVWGWCRVGLGLVKGWFRFGSRLVYGLGWFRLGLSLGVVKLGLGLVWACFRVGLGLLSARELRGWGRLKSGSGACEGGEPGGPYHLRTTDDGIIHTYICTYTCYLLVLFTVKIHIHKPYSQLLPQKGIPYSSWGLGILVLTRYPLGRVVVSDQGEAGGLSAPPGRAECNDQVPCGKRGFTVHVCQGNP